MIREINLFLNKEECNSLITVCKSQPCNINIKNYMKTHPFEIKDESHFLFSKIREFISIETGLPKENQEIISCIRYGENGSYHEHYDTFIYPSHALAKNIDTQLFYDSNMSQGGHRKYTSIIYLNDDFSGGETYFTKLNKTIKPETGKIVLWRNIKENNEIDELMLHTGKSVSSKEKWILVIYIRENHFKTKMIIEPVTAKYIQLVEDLGTATYPSNYYEGQESFKSKMLGYPKGCFLARKDKEVVGYIISFPYVLDEVYPINEHYTETLEPTCLYIHDLCVSKDHRGEGIAKALVEKVLENILSPKALVSVLGSERFWNKFGFISQRSFDYYGGNGHYMIRQC